MVDSLKALDPKRPIREDQTSAVWPIMSPLATSGLMNRSKIEICDGRADCRHFEAESHGGPEVDHRLEFGRMLHRDGFARLFTLQAAVGQVGLFRGLIAHFVQDFCDWRGCCRGLSTVPLVDRV